MLFQTTQTLMSYSLFAPDFLLRFGNNRQLPYLGVISVTGVLLSRRQSMSYSELLNY